LDLRASLDPRQHLIVESLRPSCRDHATSSRDQKQMYRAECAVRTAQPRMSLLDKSATRPCSVRPVPAAAARSTLGRIDCHRCTWAPSWRGEGTMSVDNVSQPQIPHARSPLSPLATSLN
jgi:hypothetical protein